MENVLWNYVKLSRLWHQQQIHCLPNLLPIPSRNYFLTASRLQQLPYPLLDLWIPSTKPRLTLLNLRDELGLKSSGGRVNSGSSSYRNRSSGRDNFYYLTKKYVGWNESTSFLSHSYLQKMSEMRRKKQDCNNEEKFAGTKISGDNAEDRLWRSMKKCFGHESEAELWANMQCGN